MCTNVLLVFRGVKLSSPNLNYLIIIGAALLFISVYLYNYTVDSLDKTVIQTLICNVRHKTLSPPLPDRKQIQCTFAPFNSFDNGSQPSATLCVLP